MSTQEAKLFFLQASESNLCIHTDMWASVDVVLNPMGYSVILE